MGFTRDELASFDGAEVPDLIGPGLALLIVGINPGLYSAAAQSHFASPGNRFLPALHAAGIIGHEFPRGVTMSRSDRQHLIDRGVGITNLVSRATAKASELHNEELRAGGRRLVETVREHQPSVVAILGITAYRAAFGQPKAKVGRQPEGLAGAELWVVPNPSGLNAHETAESLAAAYRHVALAAGINVDECV